VERRRQGRRKIGLDVVPTPGDVVLREQVLAFHRLLLLRVIGAVLQCAGHAGHPEPNKKALALEGARASAPAVPPCLACSKTQSPTRQIFRARPTLQVPNSRHSSTGLDTLSRDNGGVSVPIYSVRRGDSQAHSLPMSAPGSHLSPALCAPPGQLLFLINVFDRYSSELTLRCQTCDLCLPVAAPSPHRAGCDAVDPQG